MQLLYVAATESATDSFQTSYAASLASASISSYSQQSSSTNSPRSTSSPLFPKSSMWSTSTLAWYCSCSPVSNHFPTHGLLTATHWRSCWWTFACNGESFFWSEFSQRQHIFPVTLGTLDVSSHTCSDQYRTYPTSMLLVILEIHHICLVKWFHC